MNIHKTVRFLTLTGTVAMMPGIATAGNPTVGTWSATGGNITATGGLCAGTFTCTSTVAGDGFLQQTVTDGTDSFIRTIIVESGVTGTDTSLDYTDETFVKTGTGVTGLMGKQSMTEAATNFTSSAQFSTGWALGAGADVILSQSSSTGSGDTLFQSSYAASIDLDSSGANVGQTMAIKQSAFLSGLATSDAQKFMIQQASGTLLTGGTTADTVTLDDGVTGTNDAVTFDGTAASADIMVVWIGQEVSMDATLGATTFGYQSFTDRASAATDGTDFTDVSSLSGYAPVDWGGGTVLNTIFGAAPDFATFTAP